MFYTITYTSRYDNDLEIYQGHIFKDGLNVINYNHESLTLDGNGFWFVSKEFLRYFLKRGKFIREVMLPDKSEYADLKTTTHFLDINKKISLHKSNVIILGQRYDLSDFKTLDLFDLFSNNDLIDHAFRDELIYEKDEKYLFFAYLRKNGWPDPKYTKKMLLRVSSEVKNWLEKYGQLVEYD